MPASHVGRNEMGDDMKQPAQTPTPTVAARAPTPTAWLSGFVGDIRRGWQERLLARRVSRASLRTYRPSSRRSRTEVMGSWDGETLTASKASLRGESEIDGEGGDY